MKPIIHSFHNTSVLARFCAPLNTETVFYARHVITHRGTDQSGLATPKRTVAARQLITTFNESNKQHCNRQLPSTSVDILMTNNMLSGNTTYLGLG
jgi:hypothetical protein